MTGINQGVPETAIGEPIRLGSNNEFEIEQHPVSDRLIIRDTVNGKVAYVRKERGGEIGGDGVLIKALKESKPMADDGRTYDTIQQAERAANGWVFVPPGAFNESLSIDTEGLTLRGSGYNTLISSDSGVAIDANVNNVTVSNLSAETTSGTNTAVAVLGDSLVDNVSIRQATRRGIRVTRNSTVSNCNITNCDEYGVRLEGSFGVTMINSIVHSTNAEGVVSNATSIVANNVFLNTPGQSIWFANGGTNSICIGNRVINSGNDGIFFTGNDIIISNNRVSDSANADIDDNGTGTVLDANLTGASN